MKPRSPRRPSLARSLALATFWAASASSPAALAQSATAATSTTSTDEPDDYDAHDEPAPFGHRRQLGLRAGLTGGYRMIFRYDESPYCTTPDSAKLIKDQQKFCGHSSPMLLDLALGYALTDAFEPFAWVRLGLGAEDETDTRPLVAVGAGARIYAFTDARVQLFIEPALALELEDGRGRSEYRSSDPQLQFEYKTDVLVHIAVGPQVELTRNIGLFLAPGVTQGMLRSLNTTLELSAGIQGRYGL